MKKWYKECPFCKNEIKKDALKCMYCKKTLPEEKPEMKHPKTKECPFCRNEIKYEAIKCQYCGEMLDSNIWMKMINNLKWIWNQIKEKISQKKDHIKAKKEEKDINIVDKVKEDKKTEENVVDNINRDKKTINKVVEEIKYPKIYRSKTWLYNYFWYLFLVIAIILLIMWYVYLDNDLYEIWHRTWSETGRFIMWVIALLNSIDYFIELNKRKKSYIQFSNDTIKIPYLDKDISYSDVDVVWFMKYKVLWFLGLHIIPVSLRYSCISAVVFLFIWIISEVIDSEYMLLLFLLTPIIYFLPIIIFRLHGNNRTLYIKLKDSDEVFYKILNVENNTEIDRIFDKHGIDAIRWLKEKHKSLKEIREHWI